MGARRRAGAAGRICQEEVAVEHLVITGRSGSGVSTTAVNLSAALAEQADDLDAQVRVLVMMQPVEHDVVSLGDLHLV